MSRRPALGTFIPAVVLIVPAGLVAAPAQAATATTLTLASSLYQPVSYNADGYFKARLRTAAGKALGNRTVTLWSRPVGATTWVKAGGTRTSSTGLGRFSIQDMKRTVQLQARFAGTSTLAPVRSKILLQKVIAPLSGLSVPTKVYTGDTPVARGTTASSLTGGTAVVEAYRLGSWFEKGRATIGSGGAIEVPFTPETPSYDWDEEKYNPASYRLRTLESSVLSTGAKAFQTTTENFGLAAHTVNGDKGTPVSMQLAAQGGEAPFTFSIVDGALPPGITLASGGLLSGTPTAKGSYQSTLKVVDGAGRQATSTLYLNIFGDAITVTPDSFPTATIGQYYETYIGASGGVGPYDYDVEGLPSGLTLYDDGTIAGYPDEAGSFEVRVHVFDQDLNATSKDIPLTITAG